MTDEILNMTARRNIKVESAERERPESKIRLERKRAREKWYSDKCTERNGTVLNVQREMVQ